MVLDTLNEGQSAKVKDILATGNMRRRLQDLGVIEGTEIECLQKNSYGDLVAFLIRGATIALRSEDSKNIIVCV